MVVQPGRPLTMSAPRTALLLTLVPLLALLASSDPSPPRPITGCAIDDLGPVANARVRLRGSAEFTLTDADGRFSLPFAFGASRRVTVAAEGRFIAGAEIGQSLNFHLERLPESDDPGYAWVDPHPESANRHACANCHGEIYREWNASGHARSATGRHFLDLYAGRDRNGNKPSHAADWSLLGQYPDGSGVCTACHAPTVQESDPAYFDLREVRGSARNGVHCDYCHKITDVRGPFGLAHGRFGLTLKRPTHGQLFFGPLDDVDRGEDVYSPLYRDSRYCASCHEGTVFGVHVYSTWSEWQASPAAAVGKQCQDCHTKPTGLMTNLAPGRGGIPRDPRTLGNHRFFADSREAMLRDAVRLDVETRANEVVVALRADGAGHRVPTGYVDRHLLLVVEGLDVSGRLLPSQRGPVLPAVVGDLAGKPGVLFARVLRDFDGRSPAPFWLAEPDVVDTRLTPGRTERYTFGFPSAVKSVRVRLLYRRFWQTTADAKGWTDNETTVHQLERELPQNPVAPASR